MSAPTLTAAARIDPRRLVWLFGTIGLTAAAFAVTIAMAPAVTEQPVQALGWLLFVGSSVHVASTGWFYAVPEVRVHMAAHRLRYVVVPLALVAGTAGVAAAIPEHAFTWLLLGFFAWQFFHFQKQNLGMAALAGISTGAGSVSRAERRALVAAGLAGTAGLLVHPELLQLTVDAHVRYLFPATAAVFLLAVLVGTVLIARRRRGKRPPAFVLVYVLSLLFFAPVFLFTSPYAAVAGLTLAHGFQYLLIVGLVADARSVTRSPLTVAGRRVISLLVLVNVALIGGLALNAASHLHSGGPAARAVYGAYLGIVMAHFVIDAGLWRLRDEFPRTFLRDSLPYLLAR
ncbi:MAG TPA: hypothetical protein VKB69_01750 [Micromonosporaceae bacterium]|nr:hypothetical protein [Micromonosporaceae bacterium]